jgi:hypothetical protein
MIIIHDLVDPTDPDGRTYKQVNSAKTHQIPIGSLVEILPDDSGMYDGVRLFVCHHGRDCDGTPLYAMTWDRTDTTLDDPRFYKQSWLHGFPEDSLQLISLPQ